MKKSRRSSSLHRYFQAATVGQRRAAFAAAVLCVLLLLASIALFFATELSLVNPAPTTAAESAYVRALEDESQAAAAARAAGADVDTFPAVVTARIQMAQAQLDMGQISVATRLVGSVIDSNPDNNRARILQANIFEQTQDHHLALTAYREILERAGSDDPEVQREALRGIGASLLAIGDQVQAYDSLTRAAIIPPASISLHLAAGEIALALENWQDAALHFYSVLRFEPTNEIALDRLAQLEREHASATTAALEELTSGQAFAGYRTP